MSVVLVVGVISVGVSGVSAVVISAASTIGRDGEEMTGMVDWLQNDENSRSITRLQPITCLDRSGVFGHRQGGRESYYMQISQIAVH